jgi:hypothetical protein
LGDWQLDRLPEEVRQNAEDAARRDGLPLHRWLGNLIRDTCAEEGVPTSRELSPIGGNEPSTNRGHQPAAIATRPTLEPIVVMPDVHATERRIMIERHPLASRNGFARDRQGNPAVKNRAVQPWVQSLTITRGSIRPATPPTDPPTPRHPPEAASPGSTTILTATPAAVLMALEPAAPQGRAAPGTVPPTPMTSFPSAASRSDDRPAVLATLVQRLRRNELSPMAEARLFMKLINEETASIAAIALVTGRTEEQIARSLRLMSLPDKERDMIDRGTLSRAAAFQLLDNGSVDPANPIVSARIPTP